MDSVNKAELRTGLIFLLYFLIGYLIFIFASYISDLGVIYSLKNIEVLVTADKVANIKNESSFPIKFLIIYTMIGSVVLAVAILRSLIFNVNFRNKIWGQFKNSDERYRKMTTRMMIGGVLFPVMSIAFWWGFYFSETLVIGRETLYIHSSTFSAATFWLFMSSFLALLFSYPPIGIFLAMKNRNLESEK